MPHVLAIVHGKVPILSVRLYETHFSDSRTLYNNILGQTDMCMNVRKYFLDVRTKQHSVRLFRTFVHPLIFTFDKNKNKIKFEREIAFTDKQNIEP